jgi:hypothetical protein
MPKVQLPTEDWVNISTSAPMTVDTAYRFQNVGQNDISIAFSTTKPAKGDTSFVYGPRQPDKAETLIYDGTKAVWGIGLLTDGAIALEEVV